MSSKKMGAGGQASSGGPTLFYFFFSLSERALPYMIVSSQWEYFIGPGPNLNLRLSFSSSAITLRAERAKLPSLPQITLDKSNSGFFPANRSNNVPTIMWMNSVKPTFIRVLSACPTYLKLTQPLQIEDWKKLQLKVVFFYFGVFKYEKVSVLKFHLWNIKLWELFFSRENYLSKVSPNSWSQGTTYPTECINL